MLPLELPPDPALSAHHARTTRRGKQNDLWKGSLRDWPDPDGGMWQTGQSPTWKSVNYKRWPLHRIPKYDRVGIEVNL